MTLAEFLLARIADDEGAARAADGMSPEEFEFSAVPALGRVLNPARVLADCEVKRRIVELHGRSHECSTYDHRGEVDDCTWCLTPEDCSTLRLLALPHADHPDHDEAWRP